MDNIRIAVRDSTDSYNVAFFDIEAGIKFKTPNLTKFLAGSASMLSLSFNSKDIDTVKTGCKLSFVYKNKPYWLNIMDIQKNGFKMDLIAYSLVLEINNEQKGSYKSDKAQSIAEYVRIFDPENSLTIGINEVADKSIKLDWTGTDTLLDRLYSIANSFDAEFEFVTETNSDYSLRRHVLNIYRKGNLGKDLTGQPVRVGKDLKVINYSDNIKELYSAVHATGKDGLTIAGLTKTVNDDAGKPLYVTDGAYLRAPQTRNRFPSVGRNSTDNYLLLDLGSTEYETKEALYGYMLAELKKASVPKVSYTAEGSMDGEVGDKMTLIDDLHYDPPLYVQGRISEMTEDIITGRVTETTFTNYERKYSQLSDDLLKRVEELAKEAMPYTLELSTNNGTAFKNGLGSSLITPTLKRGTEVISGASFAWYVNGALSKTGDTFEVLASTVEGTTVIKVEAIIRGQVVASTEVTFTNVDDGKEGATVQSISTMNKLSDTAVVSKTGSFSTNMPNPTKEAPYVVSYLKTTLTDGTVVESDAFISETWNDSYVGKSEISVTPEGIVTSASKTVNGQTIASMIAQRAEWVEIIAQFLKIKADMIVDGAITADKLNVTKLSSIISNLGEITGGSLTLSNHYPEKTFTQVVESNPPTYIQVKIPEHDTIMEIKEQYIRFKGTPSYMPIDATTYSVPNTVINQRGVFWTSSDYKSGLPEGSSSIEYMPVDGRGKTGIKVSSSKNIVLSSLNADIVLKASNYTDWTVSTVNRNVRWKVQGNLVIVDYDVTFSSSGNQAIVIVPTTYVPKALMLTAKTWMDDNTKDRNAQLNADGGLHILGAEANRRYCGQIVWAY